MPLMSCWTKTSMPRRPSRGVPRDPATEEALSGPRKAGNGAAVAPCGEAPAARNGLRIRVLVRIAAAPREGRAAHGFDRDLGARGGWWFGAAPPYLWLSRR